MFLPQFDRPAIDIHSHFNSGSPADNYNYSIQHTHLCDLPFLKKQYDRFGIREAAFSTYSSVLSNDYIIEENNRLYQMVCESSWMYQWVVIHAGIKETFAQADMMLENPHVLGLKVITDFHSYDILEHADEIFSFANERKTTILMHPAYVEEITEYADKYPNMNLIIAHLCGEEHIGAVKKSKVGNVYTDTSGSMSALNNVIEYACEQAGADKILFGTDTYSLTFQYSRIALADISQEEKEKILYKNAIKMFPRAFG